MSLPFAKATAIMAPVSRSCKGEAIEKDAAPILMETLA
jgi:hypothetical protein